MEIQDAEESAKNISEVSNTAEDHETILDENKENLTEHETTIQGEATTEGPTEGPTEAPTEALTEALEELEGETFEGEHVEVEGDHVEVEAELGEGKELLGEHLGEELQGEEEEKGGEEEEKQEEPKAAEEIVEEEEEKYVEEPPPDPAAPFDFSDSKEALKPPFQLRPDQLAEVEQLWDLYQNHTPAYSEIDGYITEKELAYMLKALILMTYTPEQFQELIAFCARPPHPQGHIFYEQFVKMVTLRQRDFPIEEELRKALQVLDPDCTGLVDREYLKELLTKQGHKLSQRHIDAFIKEVDMTNDGTIGIEDVVGTLSIDLNKDDILMLIATLNPPDEELPPPDN